MAIWHTWTDYWYHQNVEMTGGVSSWRCFKKRWKSVKFQHTTAVLGFKMFQYVSSFQYLSICFVFHLCSGRWFLSQENSCFGVAFLRPEEMPRGPCTLTHLQPCRAHLLRTRWGFRQPEIGYRIVILPVSQDCWSFFGLIDWKVGPKMTGPHS